MLSAARVVSRQFRLSLVLAGLLSGTLLFGAPPFALALSELQSPPGQSDDIEIPAAEPAEPATELDEDEPPRGLVLPLPDPLIRKPGTETDTSVQVLPSEPVEAEVFHDISQAPEPVRRMRELIVEAAASGDAERLRSLTNQGPNQTQIMGTDEDDPVEALKHLSGDPDGLEVLAIMLDILSTGFARVDAGTPEETYVWPYFVGKSLESLTPPEKVDLLRIVTAGDLADMQEYGNYNFYRIGITPDGQWKFLTAGD